MLVLEGDDPELFTRLQEKNLLRQYDLLKNCIEIGLKQGPTAFDKYMLWALNHAVVTGISQRGWNSKLSLSWRATTKCCRCAHAWKRWPMKSNWTTSTKRNDNSSMSPAHVRATGFR